MPDYPEPAFDAAVAAIRAEYPMITPGMCAHLATLALDAAAPVLAESYEDLLGSIWLYIGWRFVTKQLTTPQKELFADAVDASSRRMAAEEGPEFGPPSRADRWWQDDRQPVLRDMAGAIGRDRISEPCQQDRHGECTGWRTPGAPLHVIARDPCECPMHDSGGAICWGDIRRVQVRP